MEDTKNRVSTIFRTSIVGIVANVILATAKVIIGLLAHSIAITMDAVNNFTDAASSIITMVGIFMSSKDPDKKHPFGHGRAEYLSTMAIAVIILYAGVTACVESVKNIINPSVPDYQMVMLVVVGLAILVKVGLGLYFIKKGKEANSDSLAASGKDALFDVLISTATLVAAIIFLTAGVSLEAYLGVIISLVIMKSGIEVMQETVSQILGEGASVELVKKVKRTIAEHEHVRGAYDLVFHNYGKDRYIASVHMEVDSDLSANEIDVLSRHITEDIFNEYGIYLAAIGIYSNDDKDPVKMKKKMQICEIVLAHEHVNQVHGFFMDEEEKKIRFDMVISFDAKSREALYEHVMNDLKAEFPEYEISAGMDADFNEI